MDSTISPQIFAIAWFVCILLSVEIGRWAGARFLKGDPDKGSAGIDLLGGSVFALCGLMIAFTLTGSTSRYDERRMLIAEEANDIGTAYLRLDLLPVNTQPALRQLFRDYVDSRISVYSKVPDMEAVKAELARSSAIQHAIWTKSVAATKEPGVHVDGAKLLVPALNNMIDITTTRLMAARVHPPTVLYGLLFVLGICSALVAGIRMAGAGSKRWLYTVLFTIIMCASAYVILAIEYPRMSFINLGSYDQVLMELKMEMR